eukprot:8694905-Heterocapsa_arctica.AAC.1
MAAPEARRRPAARRPRCRVGSDARRQPFKLLNSPRSWIMKSAFSRRYVMMWQISVAEVKMLKSLTTDSVVLVRKPPWKASGA